ncbi:MAG: NYN domain-containing protein, partial [Bacteroides sp.]|nr:NYN domain-containing protein [Bacteroides sp.]
ALEEQLSLNINISGIMNFIRRQVSQVSRSPLADCQITESHYFRGRYRVNEANRKHLLFCERKFEDTLIENDVIFHYKHLREIQKNGAIIVVEKGIDVWFALEAYELATIRKFNYVVLITGDADHEMLIRKLKALKIHTILLTWDVLNDKSTSTAKLLREEACMHLEISDLLAEDKALLQQICK